MPENITIHVLAQDLPKQAMVCVTDNGNLQALESRWDGSYLVVQMHDRGAFFILTPRDPVLIMMLPVAAVLLAAAVAVWLVVKKKGRKEKADGEEAKQEQKGVIEESQETQIQTEEEDDSDRLNTKEQSQEANKAIPETGVEEG